MKARDEAVVDRNVAVSKKRQAEIDKQAIEVEKKEIVVEKQQLEKSIEPMRQEQQRMQETIQAFPAKLAAQDNQFKQRTAEQRAQYEAQEKQLKLEQARQERKLQADIDTLGQQKETLADEKQNLVGQVVELNESSKLLRYKSGLTQISTALSSGDYRDARKSLAQYQNQQDWEIGRLNLLAHPEVKSLYPSEPITSVSATADGQQVADCFCRPN